MKKIQLDDKILSISHNDMDGAVCQIILGHVYKNIKYIHTSFYKIDDILLSLDYDLYDWVILTDIHPDKEENLNLSDKIILIDHHKSAQEYHDMSKNHFVISDKNVCAAVLTKMFVEKMYGIKLDDLKSLVYLTNDYDVWNLKNSKSKLMNDVMFYLYRPVKFREQFFNGRTKFTKDEIIWLKKRRKIFKELYDNIEIFEFSKINGCIVESREFINEICHKLMEEEGYNIVFVRNPSNQRVSVRHNLDENVLDAGGILKAHGWGGGHAQSAGMFTTDGPDFKMKVVKIEEEIEKILSKKE